MLCLSLFVVALVASSQAIGPCHEAIRNLEAKPPMLGQFRPECSTNGDYEARQCHEAMCFCVMRDGAKIERFQAHVAASQAMTCSCARDQAEYMRTGLIGKLFWCDSLGNYMKNHQ